MSNQTIRATIYLEPELHKALRLKSVSFRRSMSELVNEAVRTAMNEDAEDLAAFAKRNKEKSISYEEFLTQLKADGTL